MLRISAERASARYRPSPVVRNSRSRSQTLRPWVAGSSSGCMCGSFQSSGSSWAIRWPRTRYMLIRLSTSICFCTWRLEPLDQVVDVAVVAGPARRARPSTWNTSS